MGEMMMSTGITGDRRQHERLYKPQLYLRVAGKTFHTIEWSYGGFVIEDRSSLLPAGALLRIDGLADEETYRHAQPPFQVDIRARVIRTMPELKQAALTCLKLDDAAYCILNGVENGVAFNIAEPVMANPA